MLLFLEGFSDVRICVETWMSGSSNAALCETRTTDQTMLDGIALLIEQYVAERRVATAAPTDEAGNSH